MHLQAVHAFSGLIAQILQASPLRTTTRQISSVAAPFCLEQIAQARAGQYCKRRPASEANCDAADFVRCSAVLRTKKGPAEYPRPVPFF